MRSGQNGKMSGPRASGAAAAKAGLLLFKSFGISDTASLSLTIELCTLCSCAGPGLPKAREVLSVNNKWRNGKGGTKGPPAHPYSWPTAGNMNRKSSSNGAVRTANALRTSLHFRDADSMKNKTCQRDHPIVEEMTEDGHCTFTVCPMLRLRLDIGHQWLQCTEQARAG